MSDILTVGKSIIMPCMRKGLVSYPKETVFVSQEALTFMAQSAMGIPVVIDHPENLITDETIKDINIVGRVAHLQYDSFRDEWLAEFIVDKQEAVDLLKDGWGVSTAWFGDKYASGGTLNNVPYDRELLEGRYEHLAIVKTPRYEMAVNPIFLNSKTCQSNETDSNINKANTHIIINKKIEKEGSGMIGKIFKRLITREEIHTNEGEEVFVNVDGQDVALSHMVSVLKLNKKNEEETKKEKEEEKKMANGTDEVDVDGEKMTVNELVKAYKASCKKNETEAEAKAEKEVEKKVEKLEKEVEDEKKEEKKENSLDEKEAEETFKKIKTLHENGITYELQEKFLSLRDKVNEGRKRYGK